MYYSKEGKKERSARTVFEKKQVVKSADAIRRSNKPRIRRARSQKIASLPSHSKRRELAMERLGARDLALKRALRAEQARRINVGGMYGLTSTLLRNDAGELRPIFALLAAGAMVLSIAAYAILNEIHHSSEKKSAFQNNTAGTLEKEKKGDNLSKTADTLKEGANNTSNQTFLKHINAIVDLTKPAVRCTIGVSKDYANTIYGIIKHLALKNVSNLANKGQSTYYAAPTGVAAYGLAADSFSSDFSNGYCISATSVIGNATIYDMAVHGYDPESGYQTPYMNNQVFSMQLNVVIVQKNSSSGRSYDLWAQNIVHLNANNGGYKFDDEIRNMTDYRSLEDKALSGKGHVVSAAESGNNQSYYQSIFSNKEFYKRFGEPLNLKPVITLAKDDKTKNVIRFGYVGENNETVYYDNVTLNGGKGDQLEINIDPSGLTNVGTMHDAELVFCGDSDFNTVWMDRLNAVLKISYGDNGVQRDFPALLTMGSSTAERAANLKVTQGNKSALVTTGEISVDEGNITITQ